MEYDGASPSQLASIGAELVAHPAGGKPLGLDGLAKLAQDAGFAVAVEGVSLDDIRNRRCMAIVSLKGAGGLALVTAVSAAISLLKDSAGVDYYAETPELESEYAGTALLLASSGPVIKMVDPIVSRTTTGIMSRLAGDIPMVNVSGHVIRISPRPCGCSGGPGATVSKDALNPGEVADVMLEHWPQSWDPEVRAVPMQTDDPSCPVFFVGLMCLSPDRVSAWPASVDITTDQYYGGSARLEVYIPGGSKFLGAHLDGPAHGISFDVISHMAVESGQVGAFHRKAPGRQYSIAFTLSRSSSAGSLATAVAVSYRSGAGSRNVHVLRVPMHCLVDPDLYITPAEDFLGAVQPGARVTATVCVRSRTNRAVDGVAVVPSRSTASVAAGRKVQGGEAFQITVVAPSKADHAFSGQVVFRTPGGAPIVWEYSGFVGG
jgi:hypothetical protein